MATWIDEYYADVDAMRLEPYVERHSDDAAVVFGNNPPAVGKQAISAAIGGFWSMIGGLRHGRRRSRACLTFSSHTKNEAPYRTWEAESYVDDFALWHEIGGASYHRSGNAPAHRRAIGRAVQRRPHRPGSRRIQPSAPGMERHDRQASRIDPAMHQHRGRGRRSRRRA